MNRLLNGVAEFLRRGIGEDVSLEIVGSGGAWPVEADAAELESVILNLAVNARDAMPDGGKLTIEASNSYPRRSLLPATFRHLPGPVRPDRRNRHGIRNAEGDR